jgi:glyoxylase-like metal-dependent hydrolase (beta-lactamase superfamily II)
MKIIIATILTLTLFSCGNDDWKIGDKTYKFEKITGNVFVIHGPLDAPNKVNLGFMNNPALIVGKDGLIVVDAGGTYQSGKKVLKEIAKISTLPVKAIISTHIHGDHWLANQAFIEKYPNIEIYASEKMHTRIKHGDGEPWIVLMESSTGGASKGTKVTKPTKALKHLDKITIAGEEFVVYAPLEKNHSDTDIMIAHPKTGVVFLSDNGFNKRLGQFDESSDMHNNIETLKYAKKLGAIFVPGHGKTGNYENAVAPYINYLEVMKTVGLKAYDDGLQAYEVKDELVKKLQKDYGDWARFDDVVGPHLIKMMSEIEERDF